MKKHLTAALSVIIVTLFMFTLFAPVKSFAQGGEESGFEKIDKSQMGEPVDVSNVSGIAQDKDYNSEKYYIVDTSLVGDDGLVAIKQASEFVLIWTINPVDSGRETEIKSQLREFDGSMKDNGKKDIFFIFTSGEGKIYPYVNAPVTGSQIGMYFVYNNKLYIQEGKISHYDILNTVTVIPTTETPTTTTPETPTTVIPPTTTTPETPTTVIPPTTTTPETPTTVIPPTTTTPETPTTVIPPTTTTPETPTTVIPPTTTTPETPTTVIPPTTTTPETPTTVIPPTTTTPETPTTVIPPTTTTPETPTTVVPPTTTTPGTPTTDEITDIPDTMPPLVGPSTNPPKTTEDPKTDPTEELVDIIDDDVPKAGPNTGDAGMGTALAMGAISLLGGVYVFKNKKR